MHTMLSLARFSRKEAEGPLTSDAITCFFCVFLQISEKKILKISFSVHLSWNSSEPYDRLLSAVSKHLIFSSSSLEPCSQF